jgi:colanic acid biosynthesis glycosyl transferase WcaI
MRILFLTQLFQPEPFFKGVPLVRAALDKGHEVEVLTGFPNYPGGKIYPGYRLRLWQRESIDGISVIRVPLYPSHDNSGFRRILSYLSFTFSCLLLGPFLVKRPQVIYVYNLITLHFVARAYRLFFGSRTVLDVQDLWPESVTASGMLNWGSASRILRWWCGAEYRGANAIAVLSPGFKTNLMARGISDSRVTVVYNWCDEAAYANDHFDSRISSKFEKPAGSFLITFAGTMGKLQALDVVIDVARRFKAAGMPVHFLMIGGGVDVPRLKELVATLDNVTFLGRVEPSQMPPIYALSDVLLVHLKDDPLFSITVPSKIQAYMFAGKPILNGVRGDAACLVADAKCGVNFEPENTDSLASAIEAIMALPPHVLMELGLSGRAFYERQMSYKVGSERLLNLLENVAGTVRSSA